MRLIISGINEIKQNINVSRIKKELAIGVGQAAKLVHSELRSGVAQLYKAPGDLNSVLIGGSISDATFGKFVLKNIEGAIEYKDKPIQLVKYYESSFMGNLPLPPLPKKKEGRVFKVEIRRGRKRRVFGRYKHGGFIPNKDGTFTMGKIMLERVGKKRYPLVQLYGPSLAQLAQIIYTTRVNKAGLNAEVVKIIASKIGTTK